MTVDPPSPSRGTVPIQAIGPDDGTGMGCHRLARDGELMAYKHAGFWQCMDTLEERETLEALWRGKEAPWLRVCRESADAMKPVETRFTSSKASSARRLTRVG